jgi:hypothetical protein
MKGKNATISLLPISKIHHCPKNLFTIVSFLSTKNVIFGCFNKMENKFSNYTTFILLVILIYFTLQNQSFYGKHSICKLDL